MNVLLIYPEFPDTFWGFKHALKFIRKTGLYPPLGLLTVAAMLPPEWRKRLVDMNVTRLRENDLAWADCAFISGMIVQKESAHQVVSRCRAAGLRTVAGGPLFTGIYEQFEEVDHFVLNEAELTLPQFLADLEQGRAKRVYQNSEFADIRRTPPPLWELADLGRYSSIGLQFSRGCPHNCEFCNVTALFGHRPRTKSAAQVLGELDSLCAAGWRRGVFFVDDNFIGNKRYLKEELLPALARWREQHKRFTFQTQLSIDLADDEELMRMMVEAGFDTVFIGIETLDEACLMECGKRQNQNRNLLEDVKRIHRVGLEVQGGFIVGFDHDTPSIFRRQIEFIQKSGIATAMVGLLQALPGTRLYERLKAEGRLRECASGDNVDGTTNILPTMNLDTLRRGYRKMMRHIYAPHNYYQRIKTFLQEYRPPRVEPRPGVQDILAFVRSIYRLGILGKERLQYWKLLLWTWFRRRQSLPVAIRLAIYGHHFRKICDSHVH